MKHIHGNPIKIAEIQATETACRQVLNPVCAESFEFFFERTTSKTKAVETRFNVMQECTVSQKKQDT